MKKTGIDIGATFTELSKRFTHSARSIVSTRRARPIARGLHSCIRAWPAIVTEFAMGVDAPSRDLLILRVTAPGDTGKVFGFVTAD